MRPTVKKKFFLAAAASTGLLGFVGYPAIKNVYPIKRKTTIVDDFVDLPTATDDLTKDIIMDGAGLGGDINIDISHWLLLSMLKSKKISRRARALNELARQRRWNDAECREIAQALGQQDIIKLARTSDADIRLFLPAPSIDFIEKTLESSKIEKLVKTILKDLSEMSESCSSCTSFYTNLSIRVRPDYNILEINDLNQVDKMMRIETRKRRKSAYNEDVIRLKAVLNNIICGEEQAISMTKSGMLLALLYFQQKYKTDVQINSLLSQILANLSANQSTRDYLFVDGWIQNLVNYTRSSHLEVSLPAFKALANLDEDAVRLDGTYGNHLYLLSPLFREHSDANFDVIFVHGLVGSVFKSWRQGSVSLDEFGNRNSNPDITPTTELLPSTLTEASLDDQGSTDKVASDIKTTQTKCWPKDWLADDIPGLRILAVDYPTALSNWRTDCDLNKDSLSERAKHVMKQLENAKVGSRPIVWVAHSMGGLLVKQILVACDESLSKASPNQNKFQENLLKQTNGIVFYSVPHKGSNLDWIERKNLQKLLMLTTEVIELQKGSPALIELHDKFLDLIRRQEKAIKFLTFAEKSISSFGVNKVVQWKGILVHDSSLNFEIGPVYKLDIDHAHTCKPHDKNAITYVKTLEFIKEFIPKQPIERDEDFMPFVSFII